ncbi:MAG: S9 family peptidase [Zunongwangia sp.]|uniref:S9 family peptidase n=2 Tax=Zunongwangia profunda TaxID=398743 RepID=A0A3D5J506_9FLAO|nr:S9 family peptidase [Flavobacteriaceae bacterium]MAO34933.1 S9 family peptidase [Zunongwangia sp.]MAS72562.1 S9 family peptidase [Zunongwangia sp.]HAJ81726.1 S9 family peptidase [Zunongwangia profunda]HCV82356.1 S9 family peptidase [Zunongwangia profunda]
MMMAASVATSQKKNITLEEIWSGKFSQQHLQSLQSLNNGVEYVVLDHDPDSGNSSVDVYSYKTGKKTRTLVDTKNLEGLKSFQNFSLSQDESKMLLATDPQPIYRRSSKSIFYIFDINSKKLTKLSDKKIQEPTFSPDNSKIAYVFNNNIYVYDVVENSEKQITKDGKINSIINGVTDWVYEEELGFVKAFEWNNKGDRIAFLRFDESKVPEFSMDIFGSDLYPNHQVFKYPKAGEANSDVSLHMYDVATEATQEIDLGDYSDFYIPRIKWTNKDYILSAQVLNRHQDQLDLIFVNAEDHSTKVVLTEKDEAYVDVTDNLTFLEDNSFIWTSERDGYNHIYLYAENGKLKNQVTKGNWEVTNYYGYDKKSNRLFYQSTENGSVNRDVYSIKTNGKGKKRLTEKTGTNNADFSTDFTYFINAFTNVETPMQYTLHLAKNGKLVREIKNNDELLEIEKPYHFSPKELSTLPVNGNELNMWIIKPSDFDESKKYPLLMFQYSGPGSQSVSNSYFNTNDYWYQLLANQGYIIACVDGRGTGFKGAEFKKVTQNELGKYELEDQIAAAKKLGELDYIDADRIGIWGWSFGGFMASNAILKGNDIFTMAIAVAPVTSWRFYDTIYTERFMTTPQENASGYDENSPINHVDKLKGDFLIVHGGGDDNVHLQNTMRMVEALIQANKQFDWAIYPDKNHGIFGGNTRLHLYTKMTNFIKEHL